MESKQTPPPPVTATAAASDTTNASADLRLLRGLCVHVLQPIVAKAQAILRDTAPHLEALEREEGGDDEDAANARTPTPSRCDKVSKVPHSTFRDDHVERQHTVKDALDVFRKNGYN